MKSGRLLMAFALATGLFHVGCAHQQLRWNTVHQAQTLTTMYEQQVLNNLAMFVENPDAIPHFAVPTAGGSDVTDSGSISASPLDEFRQKVGLSGSRNMKQAWTLRPVTDPDKLRRMRCAFQRAVGLADQTCINCCDLEKAFLGKPDKLISVIDSKTGVRANDPQTGEPYLGATVLVEKDIINPTTLARLLDSEGNVRTAFVYEPIIEDPNVETWGVTVVKRRAYGIDGKTPLNSTEPELVVSVIEAANGLRTQIRDPQHDCFGGCSIHPCWYVVGKPVPHDFKHHVGKSGDTVVWVPPAGRDAFSRLVLTVMDYALTDPPSGRTKEVTLYIGQDGKPSTKDDAYQVVKATVPIKSENNALEKGRIAVKTAQSKDAETLSKLESVFASPELAEMRTNKSHTGILEKLRPLRALAETSAVRDLAQRCIDCLDDDISPLLNDIAIKREQLAIEARQAEEARQTEEDRQRQADESAEEVQNFRREREGPAAGLREFELNRQFILQ